MIKSTGSLISLSEYDRTHVREILAGHGDWFSAKLIRLIAAADMINRVKLRQVFPDHVQAYEDYMFGKAEDATGL